MAKTYQEIQSYIWQKLNEHRKTNPGFNFSVRRKFPEKARDQYFIGVEKSGYFGFTFWFVPFYFRGASTDFINYMFQRRRDGLWDCHLQVVAPRNTEDRQMELCLLTFKRLAEVLKADFPDIYVSPESNKVQFLSIHSAPVSSEQPEKLWRAFLDLYTNTSGKIDAAINELKEVHPEWEARRRDDELFAKHYHNLISRKDRFEAEDIVEAFRKSEEDGDDIFADDYFLDEEFDEAGFESEILNRVLYGAPGTGKTYQTVIEALSLIDADLSNFNLSRKQLRELFADLQEEKRIFLTTFHASLSYEDFVEGLRPLVKDDGQVTYAVKPGIFKQACAYAAWQCFREYRPNAENEKRNMEFDALYDEWLRYIEGSLKAGKRPKLKTLKGNEIEIVRINSNDSLITQAVNSRRKQEGGPRTKANIRKLYAQIKDPWQISSLSEIQEVIKIMPGLTAYYALLKGLHEFSATLKKDNLNQYQREYEEEDILDAFVEGVFDEAVENTGRSQIPAVVLIIDEINRGNAASVFGELITLLENNKRLGNSEGTRLILPASQTSFYVPHNLFVIGTMNTADRSLIAMDAAFRRRFKFYEILPQSELLKPEAMLYRLLWGNANRSGNPEELGKYVDTLFELIGRPAELTNAQLAQLFKEPGFSEPAKGREMLSKNTYPNIDLSKVLDVFNKRLERLLNSDSQFGHAFLHDAYSVEKVKEVFFLQFIPQLQEWFLGDYSRIGAVIGRAFFRSATTLISLDSMGDSIDMPERDQLSLIRFHEMTTEQFLTALQKLQSAWQP